MEDSERRPKRQKRETSYKAKAFEKFKQLKSGNRNKYEIEEVDNVYETVDERDYVKEVLSRQDDDWIVDDDGSGYVEDGRDIFDDDLDAESIAAASGSKGKGVKRKKKAVSENAGKGNLRSMFSSMPTKKKEEVKLENDDMLSELLEEINGTPSTSSVIKPKPISSGFSFSSRKQAAKEYMKNFSVPAKKPAIAPKKVTPSPSPHENKPTPPTPKVQSSVLKEVQNTISDDELIESIDDYSQPNKITSQTSGSSSSLLKSDETKDSEKSTEYTIETDNTQECFNDDFDMSQIEEFETQEDKLAEETEMTEDLLFEFRDEWENMQEGVANNTVADIELDKSDITMTDVDGKKVFRFYWWDAFEDSEKQRGTVFLFGKTFCEKAKSYVSSCVAVRDINRRLFVLPRPFELGENGEPTDKPVTYKDLYMEFNNDVIKRLNISGFKTRYVNKKYAFDPEIPTDSDYMEVRYSAKENGIPKDTQGKAFSKVFGANSSFLEILLLERKIKGPCWLDIANPVPVSNPMSWCKIEIDTLKATNVTVTQLSKPLPPPPLVIAAINLRCAINPKNYANEIVMLSCLTHTKFSVDKQAPNPPFQQHFCVFAAPQHQILPLNIHDALRNYKATKVQKMDSEKALLNYFIMQFDKIDADLIVGHDLQGYQINMLCDRLTHHDNKNISKMGRIRRQLTKQHKLDRILFTGRLVCDIKISAKELIKSRSYDLDALCQAVLKIKEGQRAELEAEDIPKMFQTADNLLKLISFTMQDTAYILKIMYDLNVIPLALQITNIAGNVMSKTLLGGRSERNEFLLLHAFSEKDYIVPDKQFAKKSENDKRSTASKKKPTYSGGLVLDPKVGFYDKLILLMDFNSLYPSIIQEYNICFTTMPISAAETNLVLPDRNLPPGILPTEIRKLVESRREVKKLMNNPDISGDLRMQYHIRQMALKLTANSMYGCLGFSNSRFYAKNLAALVTHKGREILTNTRDLVQRMCFEVVYGDTDSIMINTNSLDYDQVFKVGNKIKQEVNKLYKQVELDIDGVFKYLLLLKKKKYAAVTMTKTKNGELKTEKEYKGLDIVRRDWSQLASEAGKFILEHILSDQTPDDRINNIHNYLTKVKDDLQQNRVPLALLVITKQLTKDPKMYPDKNSLPHVQVALRYNQQSGGHFRAGDTVPYIICDDGTTKAATQRAYHIDELKNSKTLKVDIQYYLSQQIHPVVSRICEPIEGTDAFQIANCLGLDTTSFKRPKQQSEGLGENFTKPEIKFRNVDKFVFKCLACAQENSVNGALVGNVPFLDKCVNADCNVRPVEYISYLQNQLMSLIRTYITKYYQGELTCEDPGCPNETKRIPMRFVGKYPVCTLCQNGVMYKKYTEYDLYTQLTYFQYIFDIAKLSKKPLMEQQTESGYHTLRETVEKYLSHSAYSVINLTELFSSFLVTKSKKNNKEVVYDMSDTILGQEDDDF